MKYWLQYIRLEYRKSAAALAKMVAGLLLMTIFIVGMLAGVGYLLVQSKAVDRVQVAIVTADEQNEVKLISKVLGTMSSVKSICEFSFLDEEEATEGMEDGEIQAVLLLGEDFYNDVNDGVNTPVTVLLDDDSVLNTKVFRELINDGVSIIQTTESAVYSAEIAAMTYPIQMQRGDMLNLLTYLYVEHALERGKIFTSSILNSTGQFDMFQYYTAAIISTVLLFCGISFNYLYLNREHAVEQRLKMYGVGFIQIGITKILIMTTILWLFQMILYITLLVGVCIGLPVDVSFSGKHCVGFLLPAFSLACFFHMIYSMGKQTMHTGMLLLLLSLFMVISGGCIVPGVYLPMIIQNIGAYLPLTVYRDGCAQLLFDQYSLKTVVFEIVYGLGFAGIGEFFLWRSI